ncbi:MAG TPA: hypothetical protein VG753_00740 [Candidatus Paceibacterota bacterium]|nr:hypothetical protein [Candidatus Paceibacterota bacterium]
MKGLDRRSHFGITTRMPLAAAPSARLGRSIEEELTKGDRISVISLVDRLIAQAHACRASDIHIDPTKLYKH